MRFIAHVTDAFQTLHRKVVEAPDKQTAVKDALASVPRAVTASIRREDAPQTIAGELFVTSRPCSE